MMNQHAENLADLRADMFAKPVLGRLMVQAFEMLTVAVAVAFDQADPDTATRHGMDPANVNHTIERAADYGRKLLADADEDGVSLGDMWAHDWQEATRG